MVWELLPPCMLFEPEESLFGVLPVGVEWWNSKVEKGSDTIVKGLASDIEVEVELFLAPMSVSFTKYGTAGCMKRVVCSASALALLKPPATFAPVTSSMMSVNVVCLSDDSWGKADWKFLAVMIISRSSFMVEEYDVPSKSTGHAGYAIGSRIPAAFMSSSSCAVK